MSRAVCLLALSCLLALLTGCVTETVGGTELEADPEAALERRVELARQYVGSGDWENAKRNLELASEIDDDSPMVHEAFGLVYQSTGEIERAESSFRRALRLDSRFSRARNNFAAFLVTQGRYEEAEREFVVVSEDSLYSGRPVAYINLGLVRLQLADKAGAEFAFSRALTMDRRNPIALMEMAFLRLDAGDTQNAEVYYGVYKTVARQQTPRGLLLGLNIAAAKGDRDAESSFELALRNLYPDSLEYQQYLRGKAAEGVAE